MVGVVETVPPRDLASLVRRIGRTDPLPRRSRRGEGTARGAARGHREAVHLYLDVSGSVESLLGRLHAEARGAADRETLRESALGVALTNPAARHGELARLPWHVVVLSSLEDEGKTKGSKTKGSVLRSTLCARVERRT